MSDTTEKSITIQEMVILAPECFRASAQFLTIEPYLQAALK